MVESTQKNAMEDKRLPGHPIEKDVAEIKELAQYSPEQVEGFVPEWAKWAVDGGQTTLTLSKRKTAILSLYLKFIKEEEDYG